ncbi:AAA family ATPase [Flavobacterium sp. JAS]|uniref:AAA family ATPase n=1 Tax=Flavobacterium sp. JAS TaxID=2897329 RepID=UPI001E5E44E0|nr:AAA family ATPase [Flavobacterium sp. JAS]MCD0471822.1 AAA family ATPase [Flavobacterium sp. JAS]
MIYWHIQMYQPWGRNKGKIESRLMLLEKQPIIGTGDWDDFQCRNFTGESSEGLEINDIILVREGAIAVALCRINSDCFTDPNLKSKFHHDYYRNVEVLSYYYDKDLFPQPQSTLQRLYNSNTDSWKFIDKFYNKVMQSQNFEKIKNILHYKKQIILQGPPGTGKTKFAKEIAKKIIEENAFISDQVIIENIIENQVIKSTEREKNYEVLEINFSDRKIKIKRESETEDYTSFDDVINAFNSKLWESKLEQDNVRRAASLAKFIYEKVNFKNTSDQFKLIQFHPSYTYEDFVRGITAESKGDRIEYKNVNKTLGLFADKALKNFRNSQKVSELISKEIWVDKNYLKFKENLESILEESGELLIKEATKPKITAIENDAIRVNRYSNEKDSVLIKDSDIINGYIGLHLVVPNVKIQDNFSLSKSARSGMYYLYQNLIEKFKKYLEEKETAFEFNNDFKKEDLRKYVLVIDEINRANLSSVLGELIYALEYRGETVESMYDVDGNDLILPANLYIIGTMNTADRSVGHIDYAIRRRFAFVDVLPENLKETQNLENFDDVLFTEVSKLFDTNLSPEFEKNDVQLGHSYFIDKSEEKDGVPMNIRLEYEIKPILLEYVKDGVLIGDGIKKKIENLDKLY